MDTTDEEDENGHGASSCHHLKTRERDSLEDLRVWCRRSAVLFTVMAVALIASSMRDESWKRSRLEWGTYLSKMPEKHFFTLFRMDYRTLKHVVERTKHGMQLRRRLCVTRGPTSIHHQVACWRQLHRHSRSLRRL